VNDLLDTTKPLFFKIFDWFLVIFIFLFVLSIAKELANNYYKRTDIDRVINSLKENVSYNYLNKKNKEKGNKGKSNKGKGKRA